MHLAEALNNRPDREALCDAIEMADGLCRDAQAQAIEAAMRRDWIVSESDLKDAARKLDAAAITAKAGSN